MGLYRERSPIHAVDAIAVPVLILQGLDDKVVPPEQAELIAAALADNGIPHAYLAFEGEGHGFRGADAIRRTYEAELSFLGQVFGFEPDDTLEPVVLAGLETWAARRPSHACHRHGPRHRGDVRGLMEISPIELVLGLFVVAVALAYLARRIGVAYPILLVLGGLVLGFAPGLSPSIILDPNVVFLLLLPPILFGAGYSTPIRDFKANARPIGLLAVGLVLFTTVVVGLVGHALIPGINVGAAFTLGAIVAPPDAVAATAIFRRLGVPRRVVTILEGESLINDATALIAYRFAVVLAVEGSSPSPTRASRSSMRRSAGSPSASSWATC